jgi:hypothetical protein
MVTVDELMAEIRNSMRAPDYMVRPRTSPALTQFAGIDVIESHHATSHTHDAFEPIPYSPHRSKRIWKKLWKRHRQTWHPVREPCAYMFYGKMIMHPELVCAMRAQLPN